jgi:multidrug efflux pump subunit AcrB
VPAFVSTLCICIVFVPVLMLSGAAKYLFTPLAMGVVFAMLTSYLLTRTVVPTLVHYMLQSEIDLYQEGEGPTRRPQGPRALSGESIRPSIGNSRNSGKAITGCSNGCSRTVASPAELSWLSRWRRWG